MLGAFDVFQREEGDNSGSTFISFFLVRLHTEQLSGMRRLDSRT